MPVEKALSKKSSKKTKAAGNEEMDEEVQIDTVIGKKRLRPLNESQAPSKSQPPNRRKKKQEDGTEKIIVEPAKPASKSTAKKVSSKPPVFKLGKFNPDTVIVENEIEKLGTSNEPDYGTGHRNNTRNVIRAINTDNLALLRKCKKDT